MYTHIFIYICIYTHINRGCNFCSVQASAGKSGASLGPKKGRREFTKDGRLRSGFGKASRSRASCIFGQLVESYGASRGLARNGVGASATHEKPVQARKRTSGLSVRHRSAHRRT